MAISVKEERINIRLTTDAKKMIEDAASYSNNKVSEYILSVVLKQAKLDLAEKETLLLNSKERDLLMDALSNPPKPNKALKELFK